MKFEKFEDGNHFTIGVELELRIIDKIELSLQNEFDYIISNIDDKYKKNLASEFLASMVEINTPVFKSQKEVIDFLKAIIDDMNNIVLKKGLCLQTSGTFAQENKNIKLNDSKRYEKLYEEHQVLLDNFSICGTHVHIGFENFDQALKAYNYSIYYLPLFVALSASSVFFNNTNSGIHSYRTKIFDRLPKASIPDYFDSYEEMNGVYNLLHKNEVINSTKDVWWDIRIQPHFKTLELRVCDAVNDFDRLEVIIVLFKAICQLSQTEEAIKMPMQVLKQNMWSATRYSMSGSMITNNGLISIRESLESLIDKAYSSSLITLEMNKKAKIVISKNSISEEMIEKYNKTKSIKEVERLGVFK